MTEEEEKNTAAQPDSNNTELLLSLTKYQNGAETIRPISFDLNMALKLC